MVDFSPEWLALREPADHGAVNLSVRHALIQALRGNTGVSVVDLGCGTGSNLRSLAPMIPCDQHWTLIDSDEGLLALAQSALADFDAPALASIAYRQADLSRGDFAPAITGASLVTGAALFDLFSATAIDSLADAVAANRQLFAAILTYDGVAAWIPASALDERMRAAFNRHQLGDKGFGPAAGPRAASLLAQAFAKRGYRIIRGKSPWILDASHASLRAALDRGWAAAVRETGLVPESDIAEWLALRERPEAVTIAGHEDLVALPDPCVPPMVADRSSPA
jgi:SAM-dependent methyltransferase